MQSAKSLPVVTGIGISSAVGIGKQAFTHALRTGTTNFHFMSRPGRQNDSQYIGAELPAAPLTCASIKPQLARNNALTTQVALVTLAEAWQEARLDECNSERIGLVVGGSNLQQRELLLTRQRYAREPSFLTPRYALTFMDTDISACLSENFGIKGFAYSAGGASASGNLALILAAQAVRQGQVDVAICLGALTDLSWWECQGFRNIGAMGSHRFASQPDAACRPFDRLSDGFIYGEACGAIVIESAEHAWRRQLSPWGEIHGYCHCIDANRGPDANPAGEQQAITSALQQAGWTAAQIDYVNPHGSGSATGDKTELQALQQSHLNHAWINTTKSITGHSLTAAGCIEAIATLLQIREGFVHPSLNLEMSASQRFNWVRTAQSHQIKRALNLSYGFGGFNSAVCLAQPG